MIAVLTLPAALLTLLLGLSAASISGSSMALLRPDPAGDPGLIFGQPLPIRSDEFQLASPAQLGNAEKGMPSRVWLGLVDLDVTAIGLSAPVRHWTAVFTPTNIAYQVLGRQHQSISFAFHWWAQVAIGVAGVYGLLLALRRRTALAAVLAIAAGLSPYSAWWGGPGAILGYWAGAGACAVMALRASRRGRAVAWTLASSYLLMCAWMFLYPAWFVSLGLVVVAVCLGAAIDLRAGWRRIAAVAVGVALPSGLVVAAWAASSRESLTAITGTYYPGNRISSAGEASLAVLVDAPLNSVFRDADRIAQGAPNQSELASVWLPLPVLLVVAVLLAILAARRRHGAMSKDSDDAVGGAEGERWTSTAWAAVASLGLLLAWALLPVPALVGRFTGLDRVPGVRTPLAIGLAVVVLVHVVAGRLRPARKQAASMALGASVVASVLTTAWAAGLLVAPGAGGVRAALVVSLVVATAVAVLVMGARRVVEAVALVALAAVALQSYAIVNPLYRGIAPLRTSPLAVAIDEVAALDPAGGRWVALTSQAQTVLTASRAEVVSGLTYYPDASVWQRLAPDQERLWNNFAKYQWKDDPSADPARISLLKGSNLRLDIDLCSTDVDFLEVRFVIDRAGDSDLGRCFEIVRKVEDRGRHYRIWRRDN